MKKNLKQKFAKVKLIATDFDGVLTNNRVFHLESGIEGVIRTQSDSLGVDLLYDAGFYDKKNYFELTHEIDLLILSRATGPVVKSVAEKIKIKCNQSLYKKIKAFEEEVKLRGLDYSEVLYIGNDLNDVECLKKAGIGVGVADSHPYVLKIADYITKAKGGKGAFREVCEKILEARGIKYY